MDWEGRMAKKFHVIRETRIQDVFEVEADDLEDAIARLQLQEGRLLTTKEPETDVIQCWEKPTGIS